MGEEVVVQVVVEVVVEVVSEESVLGGSEFSEDEVLEVYLLRLLRANAEAIANEAIAQVLEETRHAIVATSTASHGDFDEPEIGKLHDGQAVRTADADADEQRHFRRRRRRLPVGEWCF